MNIESEDTFENYQRRRRRLERQRDKSSRIARDNINARLRTEGQHLSYVAIGIDHKVWKCYADKEAIESLQEDGYLLAVLHEPIDAIGKSKRKRHGTGNTGRKIRPFTDVVRDMGFLSHRNYRDSYEFEDKRTMEPPDKAILHEEYYNETGHDYTEF